MSKIVVKRKVDEYKYRIYYRDTYSCEGSRRLGGYAIRTRFGTTYKYSIIGDKVQVNDEILYEGEFHSEDCVVGDFIEVNNQRYEVVSVCKNANGTVEYTVPRTTIEPANKDEIISKLKEEQSRLIEEYIKKEKLKQERINEQDKKDKSIKRDESFDYMMIAGLFLFSAFLLMWWANR